MAQAIPEIDASSLTARAFHDDHVATGRPVVLRNIASAWPVTKAARKSGAALRDYLLTFDKGEPARAMIGPPGIKGRFFYNEALTGFNFRTESLRLDAALNHLLDAAEEPQPMALAIQSLQLWTALPGFDRDNRLQLLPPTVEPRAWLGNRVTVAAHHDPSENIACVVAGQRIFTLFPPDQVANLYPGPFELTPAGPTISMVDFDTPDLARYPRFAKAMEHAVVAELTAGDGIYIPYLWWHHVRSLEPLNLLINYWWSPPSAAVGHPLEAMIHAIASIRALPPAPRSAWEAMFHHYVFSDKSAGDHLTEGRRGIQGEPPSPEALAWAQQLLASRFRQP
jgi:hypothetical protein